MDALRFFCLDSRIRDVHEECQVVHFCRDLEDESMLVIDSFEPYVYVTSPFQDEPYERLRDRIGERIDDARVEKAVFNKGSSVVEAAKVSVRSVERYRALRAIIRASPERFLELFGRARLLKRYLLERDLTPLTVWQAEANPFPHNARVPAYLASSIEQNDTLTYESPTCESITILPESLTHALIASKDPIRTMLFSSSALTWDRSMVEKAGARYVDSEIDLIDRARRHLISRRAAIVAGFRSDSVDFPRILARVASYKESGQRVDFSLSDDFSLPYSTNFGTSILGMIHMDVAKAAGIVSTLQGYEDLEPLLGALSLEVHEEPGELIEGQKRLARLSRSAAEKLYPIFAELSKLCREQVYDVSRQPVWKTYESYVDTYCLRNGLCYDTFSPDEPFGNAPSSDMVEDDTVFAKHGVAVSHLRAHLAVQHNVSRESAREARRGDGATVSFTAERSGPVEALRALLERQDRLRNAAEGFEDAPVVARLRAHELVAEGFEGAIGNRASTLYFPEGASYLRRREHETLGRASRHVSAIIDRFVFSDHPDKLAARLRKLGVHFTDLDLERALIIRDPLGAILMRAGQEFEPVGKARLDRATPVYVGFVRDILARKILMGADRDDVESYVRERIEELLSGDVNDEELISLVTMHRPLSEYENELFFVQAARELQSAGFSVEKGTAIPYLVVEGDGDLRGASPGTHLPIAYRYYVENKLKPAVLPLLAAVGIEETP